MKLVYNTLGFLILLFLVSSHTSYTHAYDLYEDSKVIEKTFNITANGKTSLHNKYGTIKIKTWDKNQVKLKITIEAEGNNQQKVQRTLEGIDIDFENSNSFVEAKTDINLGRGNWNYKIHYEVQMPATNSLETTMSYGDLTADEIKGSADITVKYGNFSLEGVGDNSKVRLAYSSSTCRLGTAKDIDINLSYSNMQLNTAEDIQVEAKYSKLFIDRAEDITSETGYATIEADYVATFKNNGKYDTFKVGKANNVNLDGDYSNIKIDELKNDLYFDSNYGDVSVNKVLRGFGNITANVDYGSVKLGIESDASYRFRGESRYGNISYPNEMNVRRDMKRSSSREVEGHVGAANARSMIEVDVSYGSVKIF